MVLTAEFDPVDQILTRLERRGDDLTDIRCKVVFSELDQVNLSQRVKKGQILFMITEPNPLFLIRFDETNVDGIVGKREWYLFDGEWLLEANERTRQVTQRQVARPGEKVDLFDIETAPFPLPFGQKKDKILCHFNVTLVPPKDDDPKNTDHLVCIPKPGSRLERNYDKLEFYVLQDLHLPRKVVMTKNQGYEIITAEFSDLTADSINAGVKKKDFKEPREWKRYTRIVEPLEDPEPSEPRP